jgi:hypothetical protein
MRVAQMRVVHLMLVAALTTGLAPARRAIQVRPAREQR